MLAYYTTGYGLVWDLRESKLTYKLEQITTGKRKFPQA